MKLKKVNITGFKSVKGEEVLLIDDRFTVLIGANDHGKTNMLQSIEKLNDDKPITDDDKNWDLKPNENTRIEWHFSIDDETLDQFKNNEKRKLIPNQTEENSDLNQKSSQSDLLVEGKTEITTELQNNLQEPSFFDVNNNSEIIFVKENANTPLKVISTPFQIPIEKEEELKKLRPRIESFYTPLNTNLKDQITISELNNKDSEVMQGIFHLAGIWENRDNLFVQNDITTRILSDASQRLTYILNEKWNQGKNLKWNLIHSGTNGDHITIQIQDPAINSRFTRPSLRSSGFQTYFVLSMMINARKYNQPKNTFIFLFDEPGTYLHPYAQIDLQRSFESVAESSQIVYATHSIFLINKNRPKRNRVVSKTKNGTKIDQKPFIKNWKSVRESLGVLLSNNFLIAEKTLLVEGPSDIIYLLDTINRLKRSENIDIDLNDFSIVDAGNSENYVAMAKLMLSEGREIVTLVDGDTSGEKIIKKLKVVCEKEFSEGKVVDLKLENNKSIEDIFCNITCLKETIEKLCGDLIESGIRKPSEGIDFTKKIKALKSSGDKTLGYKINEMTKKIFEPQESLSKLSIALVYEDIVKNKKNSPKKEAIKIIEELKELMKLKGEKSADKGVFEEVTD